MQTMAAHSREPVLYMGMIDLLIIKAFNLYTAIYDANILVLTYGTFLKTKSIKAANSTCFPIV